MKKILPSILFFVSSVLYATECISYAQKDNCVVFNCSDNTKLSLNFCSSSIIKIGFDPDGKFTRNNESFAVINERPENISIEVNEQPSCYEIYTANLRVRLNKNPMQLQIFDKWQKLVFSDFEDKGHVVEKKATKSYKVLRKDEKLFGLGEKTGHLDRRGNNYKMWNSDKPCYGISEDPLYKSIPFFMSSYRYGIFFDNTYKTEFKFGTESDEYYSFEAPGGAFVYYFLFGKDYKDILQQYITLTGKPVMPPKWALGFAQSRGLYTSEKQALEVAAEFRKRRIPCDIIYQDIGWVDELQSFDWRKGNYTDPKSMTDSLGKQGFKMIVSQDPVISQSNKKQWKEADESDYFVKDVRTGKTYDMPWPWGGNCGVVDFTLPAVADWWGTYQQKPLDDGVKGFWTDMGEPAWSNEEDADRLNMRHHLGMHSEIHNVYGLTWDKVVKEQFEKRNPNKRIFQMTRSAYAGLQRYTFAWTGDSGNGNDVLAGWERLENQVAICISAGLGGIPFFTTDISGYCGDITDYPAMAELYTRWMQFGIFNPLSRAHHEGNNAVEPWMFGKETENICKMSIELKYKLFPYLYTYARKAYDSGLPVIRGLFMEYPNDEQAIKTETQFFFGEELLVAPVLKKAGRVKTVYLPAGEWIDFNDKQTVYRGGQSITYNAPLNVIPVFVRKGSVIPQMPVMQYIHEKKDYPLFIDIFPDNAGGKAEFELYEDEGENLDYQNNIFSKTIISCLTQTKSCSTSVVAEDKGFRQSDNRNFVLIYHLDAKPAKVLVNSKPVRKVKKDTISKKTESDFNSIEWSWDETGKECWLKIPDKRNNVEIILMN
jgi:alpha-glucosidase